MSRPWLDSTPIPLERLWLPSDSEPALADDQGYLLPREHYMQRQCLSGEQCDAFGLAMLRGDSGSGKTYAVAAMIDRLQAGGAAVVYVDLARVDTQQSLVDRVRPVLDADRPEGSISYVFFDDVEKCQLHAIERHLDDVLAELARKRVRVRIAYRAGTLARQAELRYAAWFDTSSVLDLLALTRRTVLGVLERIRQPAEELLQSLERQGLVALLVQPVTLRMIEALLRADRPVQSITRSELYEQSCRLLCQPRSEEPGSLEVDQRLAIARRLAAISVFCNRPAFYHRAPDGQMPSALLPIAETLRGQERLPRGDIVPVDMANARDVLLRTGLFSALDQDAMRWWHNSIADYLAAEYVRINELPVRQVKELLRLTDPNAPVLSQLEGVIGWLVTDERLGLVDRFLTRSPLTLLRSDVSQLPEPVRREIIRRLLEAAQREMLDVWGNELPRQIARAGYPTLLDELRPWIQDRQRNPLARVLAIRFADACGFGAAASDMMLAIALDPAEPLYVRYQAVIVIRDRGPRDARLSLRPLAIGPDDADDRDDLKGNALRALWPADLTSRELFESLTPQRDETYLGAYEVFLGWELPRSLTRSALPDALAWVLRQQPLQVFDYNTVSRLVDAILRFALAHLDDENFRGLVAEVFVRRCRAYADLLSRADDAETDLTVLLGTEHRRALIEAMVHRVEPTDPVYLVCSSEPSLLARDDAQWLLACLARDTDHRADSWIEMIVCVVQTGTDDDRQHVLEAVLENERLKAKLRWFAGEIELGSPAAQQMRDEYERRQRAANPRQPERTLNDAGLQIVQAACAGDLDAFVAVHGALSGRPPRSRGLEMASLPGWVELDDEQRRLLVVGARMYLVRRSDRRGDWLGTGAVGQDAVTGLRALHLIAMVGGVTALDQLPVDVWDRWAGIVVAWPFRAQKPDEVRRVALAHALRVAPAVVADVVHALLAEDSLSIASTLDLFPTSWPIEFVEVVADAIPRSRVGTAEGLLRAMFAAARERAETVAWQLASDERRGLTMRSMAFSLILLRTPRASRARAIEQVVLPARPLAHAVLVRLAREGYSRTPILRDFDEDELATLFVELERRYPGREDPEVREVHFARPREELGRLRGAVIAELRGRASSRAVAALRSIVATFNGQPNLTYVQRMLANAEIDAAETDWQPPTPDMLLTLVEDSTRSYVETPEELAEIIVESLRRLDGRLNGSETPMAELLWNTGGNPSPKDETALSNLIKHHLVSDLVGRRLVINREVEILPPPTGVGRRPDIHAVATRPDGIQVTVYVEVKRCDNRHRGDALESQLVQQYLRPTRNHVGIYVVGHYDCAARPCCTESRDEIRAALEVQARAAAPQYAIRAVVLDTSLPSSMIRRARTRRTRRRPPTP